MKLASARAIVSGGASGLGFATAKKVIDAGGHAVLLDINEEQGGRGAKDLGERAQFVRADVSSEQGVRDAVHRAVDFMGSLTLAARGYSCPLGRLGVTDRWRRPISNAS